MPRPYLTVVGLVVVGAMVVGLAVLAVRGPSETLHETTARTVVLAVAIAGIAMVAAGVGRRASRRITRRRDGSVTLRVRAQHGELVAALAAVTAVTVPSIFLTLVADHGLLGVGFALLGGLVVVKLVQVVAGFRNGVELMLERGSLRPGEAAAVRCSVRGLSLIAREEIDDRQRIVVERPLDHAVELPVDAMTSLAVGPCRYRWSVAVADAELDLEVAPPPAGEPLRGVVPAERITGERAVLELRWRATSERGAHETVVARQEIERPRDEGSPFRGGSPPAYTFDGPVHPPGYRGALFTIDWRIVLVVDGKDVHAIDVPVRIAR